MRKLTNEYLNDINGWITILKEEYGLEDQSPIDISAQWLEMNNIVVETNAALWPHIVPVEIKKPNLRARVELALLEEKGDEDWWSEEDVEEIMFTIGEHILKSIDLHDAGHFEKGFVGLLKYNHPNSKILGKENLQHLLCEVMEMVEMFAHNPDEKAEQNVICQIIMKMIKFGANTKQIIEVLHHFPGQYLWSNGMDVEGLPENLCRWAWTFWKSLSKANFKAGRFETFVKVLANSLTISPIITGRYLRALGQLDDETLKRTLTDQRNWSECNQNNNWQNEHSSALKFRLNTIVKNVVDWQPISNFGKKEKEWHRLIGRMPWYEAFMDIGHEYLQGYGKKAFKKALGFLGQIFNLEKINDSLGSVEQQHYLENALKTYAWFGENSQELIGLPSRPDVPWLGWACNIVTEEYLQILGDLPMTPFKEGVKFFTKNYTKISRTAPNNLRDMADCLNNLRDVMDCLKNWDQLVNSGINLKAKNALDLAKAEMSSWMFPNTVCPELAKESIKWNCPDYIFTPLQEAWLKRTDITYESIPMVSISDGDWKFYRLNRDDVRGPWLGKHTHCCQYPGGQAETSAFQGITNPDCAFVVLEHRGEVKYQSWLWRNGHVLVADNVEGRIKAGYEEEAKEKYIEGLQAFIGKFGITNILLGKGNSKMYFDGLFSTVSRYDFMKEEKLKTKEWGGRGVYLSDSERCWQID